MLSRRVSLSLLIDHGGHHNAEVADEDAAATLIACLSTEIVQHLLNSRRWETISENSSPCDLLALSVYVY